MILDWHVPVQFQNDETVRDTVTVTKEQKNGKWNDIYYCLWVKASDVVLETRVLVSRRLEDKKIQK